MDYLIAFFASIAAEETVRNRESIAEAYGAYLDSKVENIPDVDEPCLQFYDATKGSTVLVPWSEITDSLHEYHENAVDSLTDIYVKYCPQLLGNMKDFVTDVLSGDDSVAQGDSGCYYAFYYPDPNAGVIPFGLRYTSNCPACGYIWNNVTFNPYYLISFSTNVPIFSSSEAVRNYLQTGAGYENAINFGTSMYDNITDNVDLPPFYKPWQQELWERVANAPDFGIGSYGIGANVDEWADDIPWIGLDSLQEYADTIPGVYDKVVDNVISGTYDSNKDIPETYSDAWEYAVSEAWANVKKVDSPESGTGEDTKEEPSEGEDGTDNTEIIELSNKSIQHIKKHTFDGMAEQAEHLTDEQLAQKLKNTTFFSKSWTFEEVIEYTQTAYNILRNHGVTGKTAIGINGEIIYIIINDDGTFESAFGIYEYTVQDFR